MWLVSRPWSRHQPSECVLPYMMLMVTRSAFVGYACSSCFKEFYPLLPLFVDSGYMLHTTQTCTNGFLQVWLPLPTESPTTLCCSLTLNWTVKSPHAQSVHQCLDLSLYSLKLQGRREIPFKISLKTLIFQVLTSDQWTSITFKYQLGDQWTSIIFQLVISVMIKG